MKTLTVPQAAQLALVNQWTVSQWCKDQTKIFKRKKVDRTYAIDEESFIEFLKHRKTTMRVKIAKAPAEPTPIVFDRATIKEERVKENQAKIRELETRAMQGKVKALYIPQGLNEEETRKWIKTQRGQK